MSVAMRTTRPLTPEEYLTIERAADYKSEFVKGRLFARDDSSFAHILINTNLNGVIGNRIARAKWQGMGNDLKVRTPSQNLFAYPGFTVAGPERIYHDAERDVLLNPTVIFEVLSPSTESSDRGEKFVMYQELDSLREYVLVSQNTPRVEWYLRGENNLWMPSVAIGLSASVILSSISVTLPLSEIYAGSAFPPALSLTDAE